MSDTPRPTLARRLGARLWRTRPDLAGKLRAIRRHDIVNERDFIERYAWL